VPGFLSSGTREDLTDPRGALTIKYVELADAVDYVRAGQRKPDSVIVWESVPDVLSDKGNAFGCFLGALAGEDCELQPPGKKMAGRWLCVWTQKNNRVRVLDAQYFGLAQRDVLGGAADWCQLWSTPGLQPSGRQSGP